MLKFQYLHFQKKTMLSLAFVKGSTGNVLLDWLERKATTTDSHRPIYKITKDCQKHNLLKTASLTV